MADKTKLRVVAGYEKPLKRSANANAGRKSKSAPKPPKTYDCPDDISGEYEERYQELCRMVDRLYGLESPDMDLIAEALRNLRRSALMNTASADALANGDASLALRLASAANTAQNSYRRIVGTLKLTPDNRSAKKLREAAAEDGKGDDGDWGDLL